MKISVSRWYVLFTFSLFSYIQGAVWMTFSCVPKDTQHDYHVKQDQVRLSSHVQHMADYGTV